MKRLAICLLVLAAGGCALSPPAGRPAAAGAAGDFALRDVGGRLVRLSDYLGEQVVMLSFWATWCVPCAAELPHLERLYGDHKADGFVVLGISMDGPETVADVRPFVRRHGLSFPVLLDEETRVVGKYNPRRAAPFNVLIGRDGQVARTREGFVAGDEVAIATDVQALLGATGR
jgi:peroxiredoxin